MYQETHGGTHLGNGEQYVTMLIQEAISNKCIATRNKCHASSNKCLASSNRKLVETSALLVVTRSPFQLELNDSVHRLGADHHVYVLMSTGIGK